MVNLLVRYGVARDRAEDARDRKHLKGWHVYRLVIGLLVVGFATGGPLATALGPPVQEGVQVVGAAVVAVGLGCMFRPVVGPAFARELLIQEVFDLVALIDEMDRDVQQLQESRGFFAFWKQSNWGTRNRRVNIIVGARNVAEQRAWMIAPLCARVAGRRHRDGRRDPWNQLARVVFWFAEKPHNSQREDATLRTCAEVVNHLYSGDLLDPAPVAVSVDQLPPMPTLLRARLATLFAAVPSGLLVAIVGTVVGGLLLYWLSGTAPG